MTRHILTLLALILATPALRADLTLDQKSLDTNLVREVITRLHGDKMRVNDSGGVTVIVDLNTRDSFTLIEDTKTYLKRFGSDIRWEMHEEWKHTGGTNEMDAPPAPAVDTGRSETVNGVEAEVFTWTGAHGLTETLWVDRHFPNWDGIKAELFKVDRFNDAGPHRNAQPRLSQLPGMVIKSQTVVKNRTVTIALVSVQQAPVDATLFDVPADYTPYKPPAKNQPPPPPKQP
jgi:hypothetical protein